MTTDKKIDKESDGTDSESWMDELVYTGLVIRTSARDAALLKAQLENAKGIRICFVRTSASYLFITGHAPEVVREG